MSVSNTEIVLNRVLHSLPDTTTLREKQQHGHLLGRVRSQLLNGELGDKTENALSTTC